MTPGPGFFGNTKHSPRVGTPPRRSRTRFPLLKLLRTALGAVAASPHPGQASAPVCPAFHPSCGRMSRRSACSIKAQDKERWSQSDPSRPQSPAVRGFPRTPLRGRFGTSCGSQVVEKTKDPDTVRVCAVSHQRKSGCCRILIRPEVKPNRERGWRGWIVAFVELAPVPGIPLAFSPRLRYCVFTE